MNEESYYFVTNWKTAEVREVTYRGSFDRFLIHIRIAFGIVIGSNGGLYSLKPGQLQEQKFRISNKSDLEAVFRYIDENEHNSEALQTLYVYPEEDDSLKNSPRIDPISIREEEEKASSFNSYFMEVGMGRSTYQRMFANDVADRDEGMCRLCSGVNALTGAQIVDATEANLSISELQQLGLTHTYEIWNGILLCAGCHHQYDRWQLGNDRDGFLWRKSDNNNQQQWSKDSSVNIFPTPECAKVRLYPDPALLNWKFERFVTKRENIF
jgi:hypothetical protein